MRPEIQHNELKRRNRTAQDLRHHLPPRCREGHPHREAAAFWRGHPDRRGEGPKAQRPAIPIAIGTGRTKKGARQLRLGPPARHPGSQPGQRGSPLGGLPNQQPVLLRDVGVRLGEGGRTVEGLHGRVGRLRKAGRQVRYRAPDRLPQCRGVGPGR